MRPRLSEMIRILTPLLSLALIALAGQAGQRWHP